MLINVVLTFCEHLWRFEMLFLELVVSAYDTVDIFLYNTVFSRLETLLSLPFRRIGIRNQRLHDCFVRMFEKRLSSFFADALIGYFFDVNGCKYPHNDVRAIPLSVMSKYLTDLQIDVLEFYSFFESYFDDSFDACRMRLDIKGYNQKKLDRVEKFLRGLSKKQKKLIYEKLRICKSKLFELTSAQFDRYFPSSSS